MSNLDAQRRQTAPREERGGPVSAGDAPGQTAAAPYNDPHLAWLVATYLDTAEGREIVGMVVRGDTAKVDIVTSSGDEPLWVPEALQSFVVGTHRGVLLEAPAASSAKPRIPMVLTLACLASVLGLGAVGAFMIAQDAADATPTASPAERRYPVLVVCPGMDQELTLNVDAPTLVAALDEARHRLPSCAVEAAPIKKR
jgi:hypothetical protein